MLSSGSSTYSTGLDGHSTAWRRGTVCCGVIRLTTMCCWSIVCSAGTLPREVALRFSTFGHDEIPDVDSSMWWSSRKGCSAQRWRVHQFMLPAATSRIEGRMQGDSVTLSNFLMGIVAVSLSFLLIWSCRQVHTDRRLLSERTSREAAESLRRLQKSKVYLMPDVPQGQL